MVNRGAQEGAAPQDKDSPEEFAQLDEESIQGLLAMATNRERTRPDCNETPQKRYGLDDAVAARVELEFQKWLVETEYCDFLDPPKPSCNPDVPDDPFFLGLMYEISELLDKRSNFNCKLQHIALRISLMASSVALTTSINEDPFDPWVVEGERDVEFENGWLFHVYVNAVFADHPWAEQSYCRIDVFRDCDGRAPLLTVTELDTDEL